MPVLTLDGTRPDNSALHRRGELHEMRSRALRRRSKRVTSRFLCLLAADVTMLLAARWLAGTSVGAFGLSAAFARPGPLARPGEPASMVFWVAVILALAVTGSYSRRRGLNTPLRLAASSLLAGAAAAVPLAALVGINRAITEMSVIAAITLIALILGRLVAEKFMLSVWPGARDAGPALIVGPATPNAARLEAAVSSGGGDYHVAGRYVTNVGDSGGAGAPSALADAIGRLIDEQGAEAVVLTEPPPDVHLQAIVHTALLAECLVLCPPRAVAVEGLRPRLVWHRDQPFLEFATPALHLSALVTKRVVDILGAAALFVATSPLMLLIAIAIKLDSRGPVLFSQERAGVGGRRFRMLKFRTMRAGADAEKNALSHLNYTGDLRLFKIPSDPRVTRIGAVLRRWSLDELPQFWNVLRGDMSLVGPRPFFEADFAAYDDHHFRRLDTKPGITGLWQIGGRSDVVDFEDVVFLDRQYIENWSLWLDLEILIRTIPSVIRRTGAY